MSVPNLTMADAVFDISSALNNILFLKQAWLTAKKTMRDSYQILTTPCSNRSECLCQRFRLRKGNYPLSNR